MHPRQRPVQTRPSLAHLFSVILGFTGVFAPDSCPAEPIPGLFPTGVNETGQLLPAGRVDPHWRLIQSADTANPGPAAFVVTDAYPIPPWLAQGPNSKWIAPRATQSTGNLPGDYVYRITFDLLGFDASTAVVTGRWSSDNSGIEVRLNGQTTGVQYEGNFGAFSPEFILSSGFVDRTNTLDFVVNNAGDAVNPTGFRAELRGTAEPVPPPGIPPTIRSHPTDVTVAFGTAARFEVATSGSPPIRIQWRKDGESLPDQTQPTLQILASKATDAGSYDVVASNPWGTVTSRVAHLTVSFPPPPGRNVEAPGPSSRRTGIVISEVHHHPPPRSDGRDVRFIELYNSNPFPEDLSEWSLHGDVDFILPSGTVVPGLGRLVIAPRPTDITAVYGITQVLGGFNSRLGPGRGRVRLHKRSDAVVLRTEFTDDPAWEAASQGGGPSRVLSRPSLGEANPAAWSASALIGGSPGTAEPVAPSTALDGIQINEVLAAPADRSAPFLEFHNRRSVPVSLDGASLRGPNTAESWTFPLASTVPAGGYLAVESETVARLLSPEGGALFLVSPDGTRILDAVHYQGQPPGTSYGRVPDGGPRWSATREPSRGARNSGPRIPDIVFTEVHFAPLDGDEDETFIELYNRSAHPVPLDDWRLAGGASYHFAPGIVLPPGEYLAVARNQVRLRLLHPDLAADRVTGNFSGSLRNQGERITLLRPVYLRNDPNLPPTLPPVLFHAAETEVRYGSGGLWGRWADGGGSSLERVDNDADPCLPGTWRESDESRKAPWSTFELTGTLTLPHPGVPSADQLQILLLGPGEALIDDVEVLVNGANRITNPRFTAGTNGWFFQGTHRTSRLEPGAGPDGSPALRVVATDRGDHVANRIRTALAAPIPANSLVTLRAKARWIHGHPEILLRLRNGSLELVATLLRPSGSGTPGAANSQFTTNAPPTITSVVHSPILPAAGETTRVFARVSDPDAMDSVELTYRRDPSTAIARTPMTDDGTEPDEVAGDGLYTGALPGQTSGTLVAFQIRAVDSRGATTVFPAPVNDSNREALVRFGETVPSGAFGSYRIWMTTASRDAWARREKMSNEDLDVTFVSGTDRVIYNAGAHYSGSSYTAPIYDSPTGALCGYDLTFPGDDRFLGARGATLDWPIRDDTDQREQLMFWFLEQYRLPNLHRRYVRLTVNGARRGTIYDDVQQPDSDTVEEWFPDDSNGSLWKTDCWNEFDNAGNRIDPCILNTLERFPASGPKKTARYRWNWRPRAIQSSANDFSDLFALIDAATASSGYVPAVEALVDIDHWMRTFAMNDLASYWDAFGNPNGKNSFLYKPAHDGWKIFCWDFDVGLGVFNDPPDAPLFEVNDPTLARMYRTPALVRRYWSALQEAVLTWFQTGPGTQIDRLLDARYAAFQTNGVPLANPSGIKSWIRQRRSYLLQQLATVRSDFAITSGGGADYSTTEETVTLSGRAPVGVATLRIQGRDRAVTWNSISNWTTRISLALGLNEIRVEGIDRLGQPVAEATDSVRITYTGSPGPLPALRINEWLALNTGSITNPATGETDDWFELFNAGTSSLDLSGFSISDRTTDPLRSIIPPGFSLAPGRFLLVWADDHPEASRPGGDLHVAFQLSQNGEEIAVFDPLGRLVDRVGFGPQHADVSEGRWPDGSSPPFPRFLVPTPGSLNATPPSPPPGFLLSASRVGTPSEINLRWRSVPGRRYQLEVAAQLETPHWEPVGLSIVADAAETSLIDSNSGSGNRFYRVMLLP